MNAYSKAFYQYIQERPLKYYDVEIESVLDLFYQCYAEGALRDTAKMKACIRKLYELTSPQTGDELLNVLSDYSLEMERQAFLEGVRVGARWGDRDRENLRFLLAETRGKWYNILLCGQTCTEGKSRKNN